MRFVFIAVLLTAASPIFAADDVYQPLWLYQGHWKGTKKNLDSTTAQFDIVNDCARIGRFFGCQQTVDGKPGPLILFVPSGPAGHYYTRRPAGGLRHGSRRVDNRRRPLDLYGQRRGERKEHLLEDDKCLLRQGSHPFRTLRINGRGTLDQHRVGREIRSAKSEH